MTDEIKLSVEVRKDFRKGRLTEIRASGRIPAVLYGPDVDTTPLIIDAKEFKKAISTEHGENVLLEIKVGSKKAVTAIIKEIQVHPVSMAISHVDLAQINLTEEVEVEVPLEVEGESPGVKNEGGVLEHIIRKVHVRCLPTRIPDKFVLDASQLNIGDGLKIADMDRIEGVEILDDPETLALNVVSPTEFVEPEEEELEDEAEPEVIGREKGEEEPEEEEKPKKKEEPEEEPESEEEG